MADDPKPPDTDDAPASHPDVRVSVAPGQIVLGKYRIDRPLGEGGMGRVVAAHHLALDRPVALKLIRSEVRRDDDAVSRFKREARAAARIESEHVGRVIDVDELPDGTPFIVMELLDGRDLADELDAVGRLDPAVAVAYALQVCEAIGAAHAAGIVHRDLKPANLFLAGRPGETTRSIKVLDFGISKITQRESADAEDAQKTLTNPSAILGSPLYMSPEQMRASGDVDGRTDLWSLGVILFESIAGRSPFDGSSIPMICANVLNLPTPALATEALPEGLEHVVARALEKEPDARYRDVAHFARALAPFAPEQAAISLPRIQRLRDRSGALVASPASIPPPPVSVALRSSPPSRGERSPAIETLDGSHGPVSSSSSTPPAGPHPKADWPRSSPMALVVGGAALVLGGWLVLGRSSAPAGGAAPPFVTSASDAASTTVTPAGASGRAPSPNPSVAAPIPLTSALGSATSSGTPASSLPPAATARPPKPSRGGPTKSAQPPQGTSAFGDRE